MDDLPALPSSVMAPGGGDTDGGWREVTAQLTWTEEGATTDEKITGMKTTSKTSPRGPRVGGDSSAGKRE